MRPASPAARERGFTLVEAIMVIVITGIIAGMVAVFLKGPIDAYMDTARRVELTDTADTALRRLARDIQRALPNSVRVDASGKFLTFVPVAETGRYCTDVGSAPPWVGTACADALDFTASADSFDVLGPPVAAPAGSSLVIYNLGLAGYSDVYDQTSRRPLTATGATNNLSFTSTGSPFPLESPGSRFQIVSTATSYACDDATNRLLRYSGYAIPATPATSVAALDALAAAAVVAANATCTFEYGSGTLQTQGIVVVRLSLSRAGETVTLLHQINVSNTP